MGVMAEDIGKFNPPKGKREMNDVTKRYTAGEFEVQSNGIVRNKAGRIVGRLEELEKLRKRITTLEKRCKALRGEGRE